MIAGRQTMLRYAAGIVTFISCSALLLWAQQAAHVAYFEQVRIKPGEVEKYETTLKRHWTWHEKQGETWSYFVWSVDTGKNEGAYQVASFGHSWKEVDESNALVAGTPGPEEDPEPYEQAVEESYYRYRPDLSIGSPMQQPLPVASVRFNGSKECSPPPIVRFQCLRSGMSLSPAEIVPSFFLSRNAPIGMALTGMANSTP